SVQDRAENRAGRPSPKSARCVCPGNQVPFYCPAHGGVENRNWPLLKPLAAILEAIKDDEARRIATTLDRLPSEETSLETKTGLSEETTMANVFVEPRPKGRPDGDPIDDYVVEDHADHVLATLKSQREAIEWARQNGHSPHVARVRHLNDKKKPD